MDDFLNGIYMLIGAVDLNGNPVERSKREYPYSYSPFVTYRNGENSEISDCVYSDRLFQWDHTKYNDLCQKHFGNHGQNFGGRDPKSIEAFLSDYIGKKIKLIVIQEGANMSSGYPYWVFHYKIIE